MPTHYIGVAFNGFKKCYLQTRQSNFSPEQFFTYIYSFFKNNIINLRFYIYKILEYRITFKIENFITIGLKSQFSRIDGIFVYKLLLKDIRFFLRFILIATFDLLLIDYVLKIPFFRLINKIKIVGLLGINTRKIYIL